MQLTDPFFQHYEWEVECLKQYFKFDHLPPDLRNVSQPFAAVAHQMMKDLKPGPELVAGLRKLLEAKDCFVRSKLSE